ncbi:MAG: GNAT family N-acetyltransferase [Verrucomicrobia subdivision 3 bacterium]|nr:GNAT family N-acetyltransferase [Limisphaerales bacterium]
MPDANLLIRPATAADVPLLLEFIRAIAEYEKLLDEVVATESSVHESLFGEDRRAAVEALIAEWGGEPAAFAVYFHNFSTFTGRAGLYLEDLFVKPEFRRHGIGQQLMVHLANIAVERNCPRFEWVALDWNQSASNFYETLGATPISEWRCFRINGEPLKKLAETVE